MKRGKDEEKTMGPMFPRLHVNDTEKGGPRAPPRNKMALYEQLSIPSQRFSQSMHQYNSNNSAGNLVPPSSQGSGNDRDTFLYSQVPPAPRHPSEMQYNRYSDLSIQKEQRKNCDEDECTVPVFVHSLPCNQFDNYSNTMDREKLSPSRPPYFQHPLKSQEAKETGMLGNNMRQEGMKKQTANIDKSSNDDPVRAERYSESRPSGGRPYTAVLGENMKAVAKGISSDSNEALSSKDQNIVHDLSYDSGSGEDGSCRPLQTSLERGDSVSETSVLDAISGVDITPDDVVGIIGQKHFWKARRAIATQQRAFAVQVFELHRLIKVQRSIAASPHILTDDSPYFGKPIKALPGKTLPLDYAIKVIPNLSKRKGETPEKPTQKKERSSENTVDKNGTPLSDSCTPQQSIASGAHHHNATSPFFNQPPQGGAHQWLIPVMSPSEGLVYKPYPGPGFVSQSCGGCGPTGQNPMMGSFFNPSSYGGFPTQPSLQYSMPSFPPHGYFPPYVMPQFMDTSAFSGSSFEQTKPTMPSRKVLEPCVSEDNVEKQGSTASSPNERLPGGRRSSAVDRRNMLPLFPTSPPTVIDGSESSPVVCAPVVRPARVIKVVPRDGLSASESAARIFRSIQEERRQHISDSV